MNSSMGLWIVVAVALFWVVGLYNRLMRIRARAKAALRSVEKHMRQCIKLAHLHIDQVGKVGGPINGRLQETIRHEHAQLLVNLNLLDQALKDVRGMPLAGKSVARVGELFETTKNLWQTNSQVVVNQSQESPGEDIRVQWDVATRKTQAARAGLNTILYKYNEAIYQFPARLVVGVLGFRPAGPL